MILALRTDRPEAELQLWDGDTQVSVVSWHAHRELAETLTSRILELLRKQNLKLSNLSGVAVFEGPGSFTGLRIGISVANALASSLDVPIYAIDEGSWGKPLTGTKPAGLVMPQYGSEPHITPPRK